MTVTYRDALRDDAALMSAIGARTFTETFGHLYSAENLAAFLVSHSEASWYGELSDPRFSVRIAEDGVEAAGFAKVGPPSLPFETKRVAVELRQLYVLKPWQGAGIAPVLMDWALGEARRRGAEELYLSVFVDNRRARAFYNRYGFEEVGRYDFMVGTHADEDLVMRLVL